MGNIKNALTLLQANLKWCMSSVTLVVVDGQANTAGSGGTESCDPGGKEQRDSSRRCCFGFFYIRQLKMVVQSNCIWSY